MHLLRGYSFWFVFSNLLIVLLGYLMSCVSDSNSFYATLMFLGIFAGTIFSSFLFPDAKILFSFSFLVAITGSFALSKSFFYNQEKLILYASNPDSIAQQYQDYAFLRPNVTHYELPDSSYAWHSEIIKIKKKPDDTKVAMVVPFAFPGGKAGEPFYLLHFHIIKAHDTLAVPPQKLKQIYAEAVETLKTGKHFYLYKGSKLQSLALAALDKARPRRLGSAECIVLEKHLDNVMAPLEWRMAWRVVLVVVLIIYNLLLILFFKKIYA